MPAACSAGGLGYTGGNAAPAPGVTRDERDRAQLVAEAAAWSMPAGVTFALVGPPSVRGPQLVLRGELANATATPQPVFLTEAGVGYFSATLTGAGLTRRAQPPAGALEPGVQAPPALFPEPHRFVLAPGARWVFELAIELACWQLAPGQTVNAHWWFGTAGTVQQGDVTVTLP